MQPPWMDHAWAQFGVREIRGPGSNRNVVAMYQDAGRGDVSNDSVPWCAAYVGACLERAGLDGTGSLMARSYLKWGRELDAPEFGAIAVLSRGRNPASGHVGFIVGEQGNGLFLLGGNQSDAVNVKRFPKSRLLGVRVPAIWQSKLRRYGWPPAAQARADQNRSAAFSACLPHILRMEGGYTNDPHDPGGPTNKGITLATYARHLGRALNGASRRQLIAELRKISDATVATIYRDRYWHPSRAEDMPAGVDLMHFDATVNHGLTGAARILQTVVGVARDGEIGPITMAAVDAYGPSALIRDYADARRARYRSLSHFWRFGRGWLNRTAKTERASLARLQETASAHSLAPAANSTPKLQSKTPGGTPMPDSQHKSTNDAPRSTVKWWGESITLWGAFVTTMSTVLPVVGPLFGLQLSAEVIEQVGQHVITIAQAIGGISGIVMTVFGRMRAEARLVGRS